jgi:SAM-dependent methyltransferase
VTIAPKATFSGAIPKNYDQLLGPALFHNFAEDLAARVPPRPSGDVLEIACGTGQVTAELRRRLDPGVRLVATDLNKPMLDYAARRLAARGLIEFHEADAMQLPFRDASFEIAVCGFGFMFVPDKAKAMRETRRVLGSGGLLFFNVWDRIETNPTNLAAANVIEGMFPGDDDVKFRVPYEMADAALLRALLEDAGFVETRMETRQFPVTGVARAIATGQIRGTPRSLLLEKKGVSLDEVIDRQTAALTKLGGADPFRSTAQAIVVEARAA